MDDKCLLALYAQFPPEVRAIFDVLRRTPDDPVSMDNLMLSAQVSTQTTRKGVWGLQSAGLLKMTPPTPKTLSEMGLRLATLLNETEADA